MTRLRVEVEDHYGTVAEILDTDAILGSLRRHQRYLLDALASDLTARLTDLLGTDKDHARRVAAAELMRLLADEAAYERVAERRGLLPL